MRGRGWFSNRAQPRGRRPALCRRMPFRTQPRLLRLLRLLRLPRLMVCLAPAPPFPLLRLWLRRLPPCQRLQRVAPHAARRSNSWWANSAPALLSLGARARQNATLKSAVYRTACICPTTPVISGRLLGSRLTICSRSCCRSRRRVLMWCWRRTKTSFTLRRGRAWAAQQRPQHPAQPRLLLRLPAVKRLQKPRHGKRLAKSCRLSGTTPRPAQTA